MSDATRFDVVIVGAGLVGSALACALADADPGRRIAVLEAGAEPPHYRGEAFDPRVVALTPTTEALLRRLGTWPEDERLCPFRRMRVWDGEGTGHIAFEAPELGAGELGHIVENSVVLRALHRGLAERPGIELWRPARAQAVHLGEGDADTRVSLADGRTLSAALLVAADGARSRVREMTGMAVRERAFGQTAIVTTLRTEHPHQHTAWQRFMATGPLAFLPLPGEAGCASSIVWSADEPLSERLMALDESEFCRAAGATFEHRLGEVRSTAERFALPLVQRHAVAYARPGLALVGDAAHSIHPLAGQGVNLGFLDAAALAEEVERAWARGLPLSDASVGRRYERRRKGHNLAMMAAMEGFKRLFGTASPPVTWLRNAGLSGVDDLPALKRLLLTQAMAPR